MVVSKRHIIAIIAVVLTATCLVMILALRTEAKIYVKNGFTRRIDSKNLKMIELVDRPKDLTDFAGATDYTIFYKTNNPTKLYSTDINLQNEKYIQLNVPYRKDIASRFVVIVDSPSISILAGNVPATIRLKFNDTASFYNFPPKLFMRAEQISSNTFIFRGFDSLIKSIDPIFYKGDPKSRSIVREKNISDLNIHDAGLSTDGKMHFDKKTNLIIYTYYYKNEFICLDSNLNLVYRGKTIDTFSVSQVSASKIPGKDIVTSLDPPRLINALTSVYDGFLFINSRIKADNESISDFENVAIFDVYDIKTGNYISSFSIEKYKGEKPIKFLVSRDKLVVIYKHFVATYMLPHLF